MFTNFPLFLKIAGSEIVDQDSLDGQLPSSSRSLVQDNPSGMPPTPPGGADPPPPPPPMGANFTKGPGAKNKKHRKLNRETEDTMSEDEEPQHSGALGGSSPSKNNTTPRDANSSSQNSSQIKSSQTSPNSKSPASSSNTAKSGSAINFNPFSGTLWERREPL